MLAIGLLMFTYHYLAQVAAGYRQPYVKTLINELTAAFGAGVLFWGVRALVRSRPLHDRGWLRRWPLYLAALGAYSAAHTSLNWGLRSLFYPLAGQGGYDYGAMPVRYFMELPVDVIGFVVMVAALHAAAHFQRSRRREIEAIRLEGNLTQARLENLRLQLQPHFLFNALNTISSTMHRDVEAADEMIQRLGDLLRLSLRRDQKDLVPLREELDTLDDYLALMKARFGPRLAVSLDLEAGLEGARVPLLLLQPLVENAIRHGALESTGQGEVRVTARQAGDRLRLQVWNDGPSSEASSTPRADATRQGIGLAATAERLRLLYGDEHSMRAAREPGGGFSVQVEIPSRRGDEA